MDVLHLPAIPPIDVPAMEWARKRLDSLTKPPGSLGRLEELAIQLTGCTGRMPPSVSNPVVVTAAADHGVARQGVSAYPREVTAQMVRNIAGGGAAISVLARGAGARLIVADAGVDADLSDIPGLRTLKLRGGTGDISVEPAMTRAEAQTLVGRGAALAAEAIAEGADLIAVGDMGIANTTAASALTAVFSGEPAARVTGRGTGISADQLRHKEQIVGRALQLHAPDPGDPLGVLAAVGGFEIAVLTGVILGAAAHRVPVVLDGFIAGSAALVAAALQPGARIAMIAGHRSAEPGHIAALQALGLRPLLQLDLRLGEGTGAVLAIPLLQQACRILAEMATFASAGISGRSAEAETARRFPKRSLGYLHALEGGIWDDPFVHADGPPYRHIVSTDLDRLSAWAVARGIPTGRIVRRDLRDFQAGRRAVAAWHIDLGGPYLDLA